MKQATAGFMPTVLNRFITLLDAKSLVLDKERFKSIKITFDLTPSYRAPHK